MHTYLCCTRGARITPHLREIPCQSDFSVAPHHARVQNDDDEDNESNDDDPDAFEGSWSSEEEDDGNDGSDDGAAAGAGGAGAGSDEVLVDDSATAIGACFSLVMVAVVGVLGRGCAAAMRWLCVPCLTPPFARLCPAMTPLYRAEDSVESLRGYAASGSRTAAELVAKARQLQVRAYAGLECMLRSQRVWGTMYDMMVLPLPPPPPGRLLHRPTRRCPRWPASRSCMPSCSSRPP